MTVDDLIATVEKTGYTARIPAPAPPETQGQRPTTDDGLRTRVLVSLVLTVPVVALAMVPAWQFTYWQWLSLTLAAPVVVYGGLPFHRAAWMNLRHGAATMDTLVSIGTLAAFGWSLWALFFGTAGEPGMTHPFRFAIERGDGAGNIYLEAAAGVTVFILAGRYFEARSKRRAGAALRALLELGAKDVAVLRDGTRGPRPRRTARGRRPVRRPAGREDRHRRRRRGRRVRRRRQHGHRRVGAGRGRARRPGRRRDGQRRRPAGRARHPGRRRHPAGADGRAGRAGADRQGRGAAPGRPDLRGLRADRHRPGGRDPRLLDRHRQRHDRRVHRRRRRAHHRLPVRARPGHADRAAGRHRPRRPARHPHQGPGGAGVHQGRRHRRARQDRHRHHRPHDAGRRRRRRGRGPRRGAAAGRRGRGRLRAPDRAGDRRRRRRPAGGTGVRQPRRPRRAAASSTAGG